MKIKSLLLNVLSVGMLLGGFLALNQKVEQNVSEEISDEVIVEAPKKKKGLFGWLKKK